MQGALGESDDPSLNSLVSDGEDVSSAQQPIPPGQIPSPNATGRRPDLLPPTPEQPLAPGLTPLSVFVGTWNLAGEPWPKDLHSYLRPDRQFDIYAIGTQECGASIAKSIIFSSKEEWVQALEANLPGYQLVGQETMVAVHLAVFVTISPLTISGVLWFPWWSRIGQVLSLIHI
eukprot:TRINITY_DN15065_c0_g1_i4.p1 TRINITY_DN15065_c0_g1~~TRINITY_DN15065_c0_g1_i4.p1  ORF type:complete len:174 (+),score=30.32 TRINITY_DN15065_c0_g1_i4:198-719(+)